MATEGKEPATHWIEDKIDRKTSRQGSKYGDGERAGRTDRLEAEQRREAGQSWAGAGVAASDAQWKGLVVGSLVGGLIGLVLLLPLAFIPIGDTSLTTRLVICAIAGAFAGGTAGALYLGGRLPELEGETVDADGTPSSGSTLRDPRSDARGR